MNKGVYYDPNTNRFVEVKEVKEEGVMCGGFTEFYDDSKTNTMHQLLSHEYCSRFELVGCIDKCPHAKYHKGIAWQIRECCEEDEKEMFRIKQPKKKWQRFGK